MRAGNYQERAIGLGADDYNLWNRIHKAGGNSWRDDKRNVVYRIHEKNSLKIRKARYGVGGWPEAGTMPPIPQEPLGGSAGNFGKRISQARPPRQRSL